ncbi:hypothetical protein GCM10023097_17050 [Streptomyces collinus]
MYVSRFTLTVDGSRTALTYSALSLAITRGRGWSGISTQNPEAVRVNPSSPFSGFTNPPQSPHPHRASGTPPPCPKTGRVH